MNYEAYALLDAQIKELTIKKEALRDEMIKDMFERGVDKEETPYGKFSVSPLKSWTYPETVLAIGESFKAAKAKAESTGEATYTTKPSLRFTEVKL
jgi:hypothetical protein